MPFLNWINKDQAMQAINTVDYRLLNFNAGYGDANPNNMLIQGDNLEAEKRSDGSTREEFACAQAIDTHPQIKHWIRNISKDNQSFRLPVATGWFYPDFVCELIDGRIFVVEYKGKPLVTNDESKEKNQVGLQWANSSGGQCLFIMAEKQDAQGRDVKAQITALLEQTS